MADIDVEVAQEIIVQAQNMFAYAYDTDYKAATVELTRRLLLEDVDEEIGTLIIENVLGGI